MMDLKQKTNVVKIFNIHRFTLQIVGDNVPSKVFISITRPCDLHPLAPHFNIAKLGFTRVFNCPFLL